MNSMNYPISKFENRKLVLKDYDYTTKHALFSLEISQAVEIKLDITYTEINLLKEMADKLIKERVGFKNE